MTNLKNYIAEIPDFPKTGIIFRDITPLLGEKFTESISALQDLFSKEELENVDMFAGIDARGFIFASALATALGKNMVLVRKGGKLPPPVKRRDYALEYGQAEIEMKPNPISEKKRIILVDDVIATGGSMTAAADLCRDSGYDVVGLACLMDLEFLNDFTWNGLRVRSVIQYQE